MKRVYSQIGLDATESAILKHVLMLWQQKRGERPFPAREQLSPRDLAAALPHLTLCQVLDGGADFQLRIAGEEVLEAYGHHFKGRTLSSLVGEIGDTMLEAYRDVVKHREPILLRGWFEHGEYQLFQREVLIMPLGVDNVDYVLAIGILLPGTGLRGTSNGDSIAA
ncbi:MAG TPA: PAS domain-containing protein [Rhizomicrobium sp.]